MTHMLGQLLLYGFCEVAEAVLKPEVKVSSWGKRKGTFCGCSITYQRLAISDIGGLRQDNHFFKL